MRRLAVLLCALFHATPAAAQTWRVPAHRPISPAVTTRTPLAALFNEAAAPQWRVTPRLEYASAAELYDDGRAAYVLDAELYRAGITAVRDVAPRTFVRIDGAVSGMHRGFADAFFDAFHELIGYEQAGREARPRNEFVYLVRPAGGDTVTFEPRDVALSRAALTIGRRHTASLQSTLTLDLPAGGVFGVRRPSLSTAHSARAAVHERVTAEAMIAFAWTPRAGPLRSFQRTWSTAASGGITLALLDDVAGYGTLYYQPGVYDDTGIPLLDRGELGTAFGVLWRSAHAVWQVGLVEELRYDAGVDLILVIERTAR